MSASRPCEECGQVHKCQAYAREHREVELYALSLTIYLCRSCARALGYRKADAHG